MRLKTMTCPNCGSKVRIEKNNKFLTCDYCGNTLFIDEEEDQIPYADPEKAGYEFEKGRQRARSESMTRQTFQPSYANNRQSYRQNKKNNTVWWVLGWLLFFPIPLTVLLVRNQKMNPKLKWGLIIALWLFTAAMGMANEADEKKNSTDVNIENSSSIEKGEAENPETVILKETYTEERTDEEQASEKGVISGSDEVALVEETEEVIKTEESQVDRSMQTETGEIEEKDDSGNIQQLNEIVVALTKVNVRKEPNTQCEVLGSVEAGTTVSRLEAQSDGWSRIDYNGTEAYIKTEYLGSREDYDNNQNAKNNSESKETEIGAAVVSDEVSNTGDAGAAAAAIAAGVAESVSTSDDANVLSAGTATTGNSSVVSAGTATTGNSSVLSTGTATAATGAFIVHRDYGTIHNSSCSHLPNEENRLYYNSLDEVLAAGHSKFCNYCMK